MAENLSERTGRLSEPWRMKIITGQLAGALRIEPTVHGDARGFLLESFRLDVLQDAGDGG